MTNHSEKQVTYINLYMDCMVNGQRLSQSEKFKKKKQYSYYSVNKFTYGIIHGFDKNEPG